MEAFDKTKTTSLEDFDSQIDYMIKVGVLNKPEDVETIGDIQTSWFKELPNNEQTKVINKATDDWWKQYGSGEMNELYSDVIIDADDLRNDIGEYWISYLDEHKLELDKYIGVANYQSQIKLKKPKKINEDTKKLRHFTAFVNYIKANKKDLSEDEIEKLSNQLHQRRLNGGCSMWRDVGIEYLYKTNKDELYDFEKEWYEKNFGSKDDDKVV